MDGSSASTRGQKSELPDPLVQVTEEGKFIKKFDKSILRDKAERVRYGKQGCDTRVLIPIPGFHPFYVKDS